MGDQRPSGPRGWPIVVRLARASDKEAALAFATATWHGWDYIPDVWDRWLAAVDGVVLLVTPGPGIDGSAPLDASGQPLDPDRAIAFSRVAMLAQGEAWLEGIRVDPRVRGMNVATDLQVAELHWAGAHRARIIRYFTGEQNEGSHRLGARHGFELLGAWRTYGWKDDDPMPEPVAGSIDPASRAAPLGAASDAVAWWARLKDDPTLSAAGGLYEPRAWSLQTLTEDRFRAHVARGEVLVWPPEIADAGSPPGPGEWTLGVMRLVEGVEWPSMPSCLVGDGGSVLRMLDSIGGRRPGVPPFRLPDPDPPLLAGVSEAFDAAGYVPHKRATHLLARPLDEAHPIPAVDPGRLILAEEPRPIAVPPVLR